MNRFTNKNGGILPFQMIKLASPKGTAGVINNMVNVALDTAERTFKGVDEVTEAVGRSTKDIKTHVTKGNNKILGAVDGVDGKVSALGKGVDGAATAASKAEAAAMEASRYAKGLGEGMNRLHGKADAALKKMDELLNSGGKASDAELMAIRK
jgi:hypothetical protein